MDNRKKKRVDVIGAGISGLASAYFLAESSTRLEIHLWERDSTLGGLAGSFSTEYFTVEKFYHHLYRRDIALTALIEQLGLGNDLEWRAASTGAYYQQRPYRLSSPLDLLKYKPLDFLDRLRLGWLMVHVRRCKDWHQLDDIPVREYVTDIAGEAVYKIVWEPLFRGKFGQYADSISAAWLWSKLVDRGGSRNIGGQEVLGYLRGGLGRVFDAMVHCIRNRGHSVHMGCGVKKLACNGDGKIQTIVTDNGTYETDFVLSGLQVPDLADILPDAFAPYRRSLRQINFLGTICLVLTLNRPLSEFYWTNVTDPSFPFVGIIEQTKWADREDFSGKHVAYISAYVPSDDPRTDMDTDTLVSFYLPYIQRIFPDFSRAHIESQTSWRAPYTQPIVQVGYRHLIPEIDAPIDNLFVCTMAQIYPHDRQVSNGVEMAKKTVDLFLRKLDKAAG